MATTYNMLKLGKWSQHRYVTGSPVTADPAISGTFPIPRGALNSREYQRVRFMPLLTGGTTPSVDLEILAYDEEADEWGQLDTHSSVGDGSVVVSDVDGLRVYARIEAVSGSPTAVEIRVSPGVRDRL